LAARIGRTSRLNETSAPGQWVAKAVIMSIDAKRPDFIQMTPACGLNSLPPMPVAVRILRALLRLPPEHHDFRLLVVFQQDNVFAVGSLHCTHAFDEIEQADLAEVILTVKVSDE
jgi:hypothetical protein